MVIVMNPTFGRPHGLEHCTSATGEAPPHCCQRSAAGSRSERPILLKAAILSLLGAGAILAELSLAVKR